MEYNGIISVNKQPGYTSHDVVNVMRRILNTRKVGHTGTLDPNASGVLPICVGKSTRVSDMLMFSDKEYVARVRLGITTDTYDIWGNVTSEKHVTVNAADVVSAAKHFTGEIDQLPPMYSAIKQNGKKLYELARKGITVERKPRRVTVYSAEVSDFCDSQFTLTVSCSKGTYIRSLCHDIGEYLGCGACMTALCRTKASVFDIGGAHTLDEIEKIVSAGRVGEILLSPDCVFNGYPETHVTDIVRQRLLNGAYSIVNTPCGTYRVYDNAGSFVGIAEVSEGQKGHVIKLVKGFC